MSAFTHLDIVIYDKPSQAYVLQVNNLLLVLNQYDNFQIIKVEFDNDINFTYETVSQALDNFETDVDNLLIFDVDKEISDEYTNVSTNYPFMLTL